MYGGIFFSSFETPFSLRFIEYKWLKRGSYIYYVLNNDNVIGVDGTFLNRLISLYVSYNILMGWSRDNIADHNRYWILMIYYNNI